MERTKKYHRAKEFWIAAAQLGAELAQQGQEREIDPIVWVAALGMAIEWMQKEGGPKFRMDYLRAQAGRAELEAEHVTFSIEMGVPEPEGMQS